MIKLGYDKDGWTRYYCTICGHIEWVVPGEDLPAHYECPLCEAPRSAMLRLDDPRLMRHAVTFTELASSIYQVGKRPPFRADFTHYSYIVNHPDGLILYDAPPLITGEAIETIKKLGEPHLLIVSHQDFIGCAGDWAAALDIPAWMGEGDEPLPGNRFEPAERIAARRRLASDLEVVPVPGHSKGSLALYWTDSPSGDIFCCGDALTVWQHMDGRTQFTFFQDPPLCEALEELCRRDVSLLLSCGGYLKNAQDKLQRLLATENRYARPWRGDTGGIWLAADEL